MGVNIVALHGVKKSSIPFEKEFLYNIKDFKDHSSYKEGWYDYEKTEEIVSMAYSGFNDFRSWCAEIVGYKKSDRPKFDWIENFDEEKLLSKFFYFADNEGHWDYETCKNILQDFKETNRKRIENAIPPHIYHEFVLGKFIEILSNIKEDSVVVFS